MSSNDRQSTARELKVLRLLFEISHTLDRSLDLRATLDPILKAIAGHMGMMRGTITLVNQEDSRITIEAAYGLSRSELQRGIYHIGEGITGKVVESGKPAVVP